MVDWFLYDFEFWLFVHFWNNLLNFENFTYFFIYVFGHFFFILNLFSLNLWCMIWHLKFSFYLLWCEYLFYAFNGHLSNNLNKLLLINWYFYHIYSLIISYHFFNYLSGNWIRSLNSDWDLNNLTLAILIRNLFSIGNTLLKIDGKMSSISDDDSFFLFKWNPYSLGSREVDGPVNEDINLTDTSSRSKKANDVINLDSI